jgi:sulfite reductase beta subunit-like hemoprotein
MNNNGDILMDSLEKIHSDLKAEIDKFINGEISAADLKHTSAPFGIYQQRNDLFMARIRMPGGHVSVDKLKSIVEIMDENAAGFAHLTTRQDIQLHDLQAERVFPIVKSCSAQSMPFKGGGGNTFRNILAPEDAGFAIDEVFDVSPYVAALNECIMGYDKAFELPRKLKIGFSSGKRDSVKARFQDLGFIAKIKNGVKGFEVFGGGGMGRESMPGARLFEFLPEDELAKCAIAMTDFFYDHGDRTNRNKARIRFILKRLGEVEFVNLFMSYFDKTEVSPLKISQAELFDLTKLRKDFESSSSDGDLERWKKYAVSETSFKDVYSVKLFVPWGNLNASQLSLITGLAEKCGNDFVRITQSQDIILPVVHESALGFVFDCLVKELNDIDLVFNSFKGHIVSCIGSGVCKIGATDAPSLADKLAADLDSHFENDPEARASLILRIMKDLRISGCPNSCSGHLVSQIGAQGLKRKIEDVLTEGAVVFSGGSPEKISESDGEFVSDRDLPGKLRPLIIKA